MNLLNGLLGFGVFVATLAYVAYDPVPAECEPNGMVYTTLGIMKAISCLCKCLGYLGWSEPVLYRKLISGFVNSSPIVPDPEVKVTEMVMDGVAVRVYQPVAPAKEVKVASRGIVYYHGGGWTFGDLDMYETMLVRITKSLKAVVVSVDYALGPEKPFPQAVRDAEKAAKHFIRKCSQFGVDNKRVALMGDSAGGTLATVISRRLRDQSFTPMPELQVMIYPVTQALDLNTPSYVRNKDGPFLTKSSMLMYLAVYLFGKDYHQYVSDMSSNGHIVMSDPAVKSAQKHIDVQRLPMDSLRKDFVPGKSTGKSNVWNKIKDKMLDPDFSPLLASDLSNLPKAYVSTCQFDVLRDDGIFYVKRLQDAGVKVKHDHLMTYHGWIWHRNYVNKFDQHYTAMLEYIDNNL